MWGPQNQKKPPGRDQSANKYSYGQRPPSNQTQPAQRKQEPVYQPQTASKYSNSTQMQQSLQNDYSKYSLPSNISQSTTSQARGYNQMTQYQPQIQSSQPYRGDSYTPSFNQQLTPTYYRQPQQEYRQPEPQSLSSLQPPPQLSKNSYSQPQSQSQTQSQTQSSSRSAQSSTCGIVGLRNIGNTCFMNSVLQCFLNSPFINDYFVDGDYKKHLSSRHKNIAEEYCALVRRYRSSPNQTAENPSSLKRAIERQSQQFYGYDQQDAQEFMVSFLDGLSQDLNKVTQKGEYKEMKDDLTNGRTKQTLSDEWWSYLKSREDSIIQDIFMGQLMSCVKCGRCANESLAFDTFIDIPLSLSRSQKILDDLTLERMIETFIQEETLDEARCSKWQNNKHNNHKYSSKAKRGFTFWKMPKILVFTIKRFNFRRFNSDKLQTKIKFPINELNMSRFLAESKSIADTTAKNKTYELFGIVNHSGTLNGGHYTADCKSFVDQRWYRFNDSSVSSIDIQRQGYDITESGCSSPYILFYRQKAYN